MHADTGVTGDRNEVVTHVLGTFRYPCLRAGHKPSWRKGWDSNPRYPCGHAGFQDRCLKPLGHPSKPWNCLAFCRFAENVSKTLLPLCYPTSSGVSLCWRAWRRQLPLPPHLGNREGIAERCDVPKSPTPQSSRKYRSQSSFPKSPELWRCRRFEAERGPVLDSEPWILSPLTLRKFRAHASPCRQKKTRRPQGSTALKVRRCVAQ